jgi:hypothetical protein
MTLESSEPRQPMQSSQVSLVDAIESISSLVNVIQVKWLAVVDDVLKNVKQEQERVRDVKAMQQKTR